MPAPSFLIRKRNIWSHFPRFAQTAAGSGPGDRDLRFLPENRQTVFRQAPC